MPQPFAYSEHDQQLRDRAALLEKTFTDFGLNVRVVGINTGPVITQYEIALETGLRVNKVTVPGRRSSPCNLKVPSVRIVAPIPGKNTVGIEVPNEHRADGAAQGSHPGAATQARQEQDAAASSARTPKAGRWCYDLADMPHLLIAGTHRHRQIGVPERASSSAS